MNPEIKAQWVSALREPGRVQGTGVLRNAVGHQCCLDVLCEIGIKAGVISEPVLSDKFTEESVFYYEDNADRSVLDKDGNTVPSKNQWELLPDAIVAWSGIGEKNPSVPFSSDSSDEFDAELSMINDDYGRTFPEIADLIENSDL